MIYASVAFVLVSIVASGLLQASAARVTPVQANSINVLIFMDSGNTAFRDRISLDNRLNISYATKDNWNLYSGNLSAYDTFIVCGFLPNSTAFIASMTAAIKGGVGMFIWGGFYPILAQSETAYLVFKEMLPVLFEEPFTIEEELYIDQGWVGQIELKVNDWYPYNDSESNNFPLIQRNVVWESSPLVKERIFVKDTPMDAKVLVYRPLQNRKESEYNFTRGEPLVAYRQETAGRILWVSMCVGFINATFARYTTQGVGPYWNRTAIPGTAEFHSTEANKPYYLWPYFNFFIYQSTMVLAWKNATQIDTYAQWPLSPIPHQAEAVAWMMFVAGLWVFNFVLFFTLGKRKKTQPREGAGTPGEVPMTAEERKAAEKPGDAAKSAEERKAAETQKEPEKTKPSEAGKP